MFVVLLLLEEARGESVAELVSSAEATSERHTRIRFCLETDMCGRERLSSGMVEESMAEIAGGEDARDARKLGLASDKETSSQIVV